jgi:hypothetical protein
MENKNMKNEVQVKKRSIVAVAGVVNITLGIISLGQIIIDMFKKKMINKKMINKKMINKK